MAIAHIHKHRRRLAAGLASLAVLMGAPQQAFAQPVALVDYDADDDNLIEVRSLEQLNAIRYDLDGNGMPDNNMNAYADAFPDPTTSTIMGCLAACKGYELMANLDFDVNGDGEITTADGVLSWGNEFGWLPIGTSLDSFTVEFHGNGHTISRMFIDRAETNHVGLFSVIRDGAVIRNVGLVGVDVTGNNIVGGLVGSNLATIHASYATGVVRGNQDIGGLVGVGSGGLISASYVIGEVRAMSGSNTGGLVGEDFRGTTLASYATGKVRGEGQNGSTGGLVGSSSGTIRASYATGEVSGDGILRGLGLILFEASIRDSYFDANIFSSTDTEGKTTELLQSPTTYTGIYANWNVDVDDADTDDNPLTGVDDPWDFGTNEQYPVLQVDFNGDGVKSWEEFGLQSRPGVLVLPRSLFLTEGEVGTYTAVLLTTPTESVTVTPVSLSTETVSVRDALIFMPNNWNTEQTVTVRAVYDMNTDNERVSLTHAVDSGDLNYDSVTPHDVTVTVMDNGAGIAVSTGTLSLMEGTTGTYTAALLSTPTAMVTVTPVSRSTETVRVVSDALTFMPNDWNTAQTVTVRAVYDMNTADEMMVLLTHRVASTDDNNYAMVIPPVVTVDVTDNGAGITVLPGSLSLRERSTGSYTVVLLTTPTAMVTVTPVSRSTETVRVVSDALIFMPNDWDTAQTVTVRAEDDDSTDNKIVSLTHTVASDDDNYNTQVIAPVVTVNVTDSEGIRVRVRVFLEGPLR